MPSAAEIVGLISQGIAYGPESVTLEDVAGPGRPWSERRPYALDDDPLGYIRDIFGVHLTPQEEELVRLMESSDRVLAPSGNNLGKTFTLACYGWYRYDAVASLPSSVPGVEEQGCILLLPGPDHATIFDTIYSQMLELAERARDRGFPMPGSISEKSTRMKVGPRWFCRAFAPQKNKRISVAHTASGRHHPNMVALMEEGAGVEEPIWKATEGQCSSEGNKIISSFNPTEASGSAWERAHPSKATKSVWDVLHLTALEHPNVLTRSSAVGGAISHKVLEGRLRSECDNRGPAGSVDLDPDHHDFLYALPDDEMMEDAKGPREDGIPGHPLAPVSVFRPGLIFTAQGLGQWPASSIAGLFDNAAWARSTRRWEAAKKPTKPPDRVGVDAAREGADDTVCAPAWGKDAETLLRAWREMKASAAGVRSKEPEPVMPEPEDVDALADWLGSAAAKDMIKGKKPKTVPLKLTAEEALEKVRARHRMRIGQPVPCPKGDGLKVARWIADRYPDSPFNVDNGSVGASVLDQLKLIFEKDAQGVSFGGRILPKIQGEMIPENMRTQLYTRFAQLVRLDLVDIPPDSMLRQEAFAHKLIHRLKSIKVNGKSERRPTVMLISKDDVKELIGRSPDRMDAVVLAALGFSSGRIGLT